LAFFSLGSAEVDRAAGELGAAEDDRAAGELGAVEGTAVEHEHYSWDGCDVLRLFRYDGGSLAPLTVHQTGTDHDSNDYLYWHYEVCAADSRHSDGAHVAEVAFTVRIDGRA
jgi:hypothetical protein